METSREDVSIAIRSAFLKKGTKQRFSLFVLIILSCILIFFQKTEATPINYIRSFVKDVIYRGSLITSYPTKSFSSLYLFMEDHINLFDKYEKLKAENENLKNNINKSEYLELENNQLRKLIDDQISSPSNLVSARVLLDKQSPYINSFVINAGANKKIKKGMAVLSGENFIGRIVDVNFFSSRVLLITDLNSKIPIITDPTASHSILSGRGNKKPTLDYLPEDNQVKEGDKVFTSGKEGIFSAGIPIGEVKVEKNIFAVLLYTDISQVSFVNVNIGDANKK
jgi:rod shape-determining protein MreC